MRATGSRIVGKYVWAAALAALVPLAGCNHQAPVMAPPPPAEVIVTPAAQWDVVDYEYFTGRVEPTDIVQLRARVTGYLEKVNFKEGSEVTKGTVLFEIDPRIYKAELARAEATLVQTKARVERLNADHERAVALRASRAISREEYDKIVSDRAEAIAAVGVAQASRDLAALNVGYTQVTAPLTGLTSDAMIHPGNLVKADDTVLTTIVKLDPIYGVFDMDERTYLRLKRLVLQGKTPSARKSRVDVEMALSDEKDYRHHGTIDFVDNVIDRGTGTLRVRGIFDNSKLLLKPGLFVRVRLPVGVPHKAVVVPEAALGSDQGHKFVYVVKAAEGETSKVEYRKVKVGPLNKGYRVIEEGLAAGERVITHGLQRVRPRASVVTKLEPMPPQASVLPPPQIAPRVVASAPRK